MKDPLLRWSKGEAGGSLSVTGSVGSETREREKQGREGEVNAEHVMRDD